MLNIDIRIRSGNVAVGYMEDQEIMELKTIQLQHANGLSTRFWFIPVYVLLNLTSFKVNETKCMIM